MYVYWAAAQLKDKRKHQTKRQFKQLLLKLLEPGQKQTFSKRNSDTTIQGVKSKLNSENKLFMTLVYLKNAFSLSPQYHATLYPG